VLFLTLDWGAGMGLKGIWIGFGVAVLLILIIFISSLLRLNWEVQ
jgi:hypothetical protein